MVKTEVESLISIRKRYPKEWVLLANYEFGRMNQLSRGAVIAHSKRRDTIYIEQMKYKEPLAIDYTGPIPEDLMVMF